MINNSENYLMILDFDDTIVEGNSEESVKCLLEKHDIQFPSHLIGHYDKHRDWNRYVNMLYEFLHENSIMQEEIEHSLQQISFVEGSAELLGRLRELKQKRNIDVIIISGGNVFVIEKILKNAVLRSAVDEILSNPVSVKEDGLLRIGLLNTHNCDYCFNGEMCKGVVIRNYISRRKIDKNVSYDKMFFAGDYLNDICLCLELRDCDFAMARKDFPLEKDLENRKEKGQLKANLISWKTGFDVLKVVEKQLDTV